MMIDLAVVLVLALGGGAAAILSQGGLGAGRPPKKTTPTVDVEDATVRNTDDSHDAAPCQRHSRPER